MAEGGTIASPAAVANAAADAVSGLDRDGEARVTFYPLGPERLMALMRRG